MPGPSRSRWKVPPDPQANVLLSFDASATSDAHAGDSVVSFAWVFRAISGVECESPVVAGTGPLASVRFRLPGSVRGGRHTTVRSAGRFRASPGPKRARKYPSRPPS